MLFNFHKIDYTHLQFDIIIDLLSDICLLSGLFSDLLKYIHHL